MQRSRTMMYESAALGLTIPAERLPGFQVAYLFYESMRCVCRSFFRIIGGEGRLKRRHATEQV